MRPSFKKIFGPSLREAVYELTDPGVGRGRSPKAAGDSYSIDVSERSVPVLPGEHRRYGFFAKRRAVKEAEAIIAKLKRLEEMPMAVRYFFDHDLPKLVALARIHPKGVEKLLRALPAGPWTSLVCLACGDAAVFVLALENSAQTPAYLYALERVAAYRPREAAHLLRKFFEQADLKNRMAALRTAAVSENLGDGHLIGEFFVKLMAATTAEERDEIVEPFLESLLQKSAAVSAASNPSAANNKAAWLGAYYHGWKNEALG